MTANELKNMLTVNDIRDLLVNHMNAIISSEDDDKWISDTVCHHGDAQKLYFYKDSKQFHCYTNCGQLDILGVVMGYKGYEPEELQKAINWIVIKLNLKPKRGEFGKKEMISDWNFINQFKMSKKSSDTRKGWEDIKLEEYDDSILKIFQKLYSNEWIDEGISRDCMEKYNILYCAHQSKIIIPHYDINNRLVGIRGRALDEKEIEAFGKYAPFSTWEGSKIITYSHPLGKNLYGLNMNKDTIREKRKIMLVEAEKSVLQCETMFPDENFTVALCGSNLSDFQKHMILESGAEEVIIALDKQFQGMYSKECQEWADHIRSKIASKLAPYLRVSILWDRQGLLPYKASPTDCGLKTLLKLMDDKIYIETF